MKIKSLLMAAFLLVAGLAGCQNDESVVNTTAGPGKSDGNIAVYDNCLPTVITPQDMKPDLTFCYDDNGAGTISFSLTGMHKENRPPSGVQTIASQGIYYVELRNADVTLNQAASQDACDGNFEGSLSGLVLGDTYEVWVGYSPRLSSCSQNKGAHTDMLKAGVIEIGCPTCGGGGDEVDPCAGYTNGLFPTQKVLDRGNGRYTLVLDMQGCGDPGDYTNLKVQGGLRSGAVVLAPNQNLNTHQVPTAAGGVPNTIPEALGYGTAWSCTNPDYGCFVGPTPKPSATDHVFNWNPKWWGSTPPSWLRTNQGYMEMTADGHLIFYINYKAASSSVGQWTVSGKKGGISFGSINFEDIGVEYAPY